MIAHFLLQGTLQAVSPSPRGYCDGFARNFQQLPLGYLTGENLLQPNLVTNRFHSLSPLKHVIGLISQLRIVNRQGFFRRKSHSITSFSVGNLVSDTSVRKRTTHHDFMISSSLTMRIKILPSNSLAQQMLSCRTFLVQG